MITKKINGYISIAKKAGYTVLGVDNLKNYKKKLYIVLADKSSGKNLLKVAKRLEEICNVFYIDNLENITQIENCKIIGIKNKGISDKIEEILRSENFGK